MLSVSRARFPAIPSKRLFSSTGPDQPATDNPKIDQIPPERQFKGLRRVKPKGAIRGASYFVVKRDVRESQLRRRQDSYSKLNAFITKPLDDQDLLRNGFRLADLSSAAGSKPPGDWLLAVKDNISDSNFPTTCASKMLDGYISPYNAAVVESLKRGGLTVVGKTNMDEFGMGSHSINSYFGAVQSRIACDPEISGPSSAGGSSGGSAVAVETKQSKLALGTDTGGSIRLPAAYTGIAGFKPSYGRVSRWGLVPYANSLDTVGFFGRPRDLESRLSIYEDIQTRMSSEGLHNLDPTSLSKSSSKRLTSLIAKHIVNTPWISQASGKHEKNQAGRCMAMLRIGVPIEYNTKELSHNVKDVWLNLLENLQNAGHKIVPVSLPSTKHALSAYYIIAAAEAASNLAKYDGIRYGYRSQDSDVADGVLYAKTRGEGFGNEVQRRILLGSYTLSSQAIDNYFIQAQKIRRLVQQDFDRVFALPNGLHEPSPIDLSELDENIPLKDKTGPAQVDLIICPTAPTSAPSLEDAKSQSRTATYMNDVFTVPASLAGLPAISIPMKIPGKYPVGMQIIGQYYDDDLVVVMARKLMEDLYRPDFPNLEPCRL